MVILTTARLTRQRRKHLIYFYASAFQNAKSGANPYSVDKSPKLPQKMIHMMASGRMVKWRDMGKKCGKVVVHMMASGRMVKWRELENMCGKVVIHIMVC